MSLFRSRFLPITLALFAATACTDGETQDSQAEQTMGNTITLPEEISPSDARALQKDGVTLIDVRTPGEWAATGVPEGAARANIADADFLAQVEAITGGDRSEPVAFICRSGGRSARARDMLKAEGYEQVTSVSGGVEGAGGWQASDLPVEPAN